jgi:hypothetical protein
MCESGTNCRRPGVTQFQGTTCVFVHEDAFDGNDIGAIFINNTTDRLEYLPEAICKRAVNTFDRAARDVRRFVTHKVDDAEASQAGARVDSEYAFSCRQISLRFVQVLLR